VLRTTFAEVGEQPVQRIPSPVPMALPVVDLGDLPEAARTATAADLLAAEGARPFDLSRGPLLRGALLRLGPERHLLVLNLHHIVVDGWSLGILVREVGEIYGALVAGRRPGLPPLPLQCAS